jgi:fluoroquinolone transport system permease protein
MHRPLIRRRGLWPALRALGRADAVSVGRDDLLRAMAVVPLALAGAARWVLPGLAAQVAPLLPFDLLARYPLGMSYVILLLGPAICGMLVGFLLLDARDDRTLLALQVTPLPLPTYLAYRLAGPLLLSIVLTCVALPLAGLRPLDPLAVLALALAAAPLAPLTALTLAAFAANKVQGVALQKAFSLVLIGPATALVLPWPGAGALALLPSFWPAALLVALPGPLLPALALLLAGLAYQTLLIALLLRRFLRVAYQGA